MTPTQAQHLIRTMSETIKYATHRGKIEAERASVALQTLDYLEAGLEWVSEEKQWQIK